MKGKIISVLIWYNFPPFLIKGSVFKNLSLQYSRTSEDTVSNTIAVSTWRFFNRNLLVHLSPVVNNSNVTIRDNNQHRPIHIWYQDTFIKITQREQPIALYIYSCSIWLCSFVSPQPVWTQQPCRLPIRFRFTKQIIAYLGLSSTGLSISWVSIADDV